MALAWWKRWGLRARGAVAPIAAAGLLAGCAATAPAASPRPGSSHGSVTTLARMSILRSLFNREQGHPRLVLIFSPT